jgi:hypothetical protein
MQRLMFTQLSPSTLVPYVIPPSLMDVGPYAREEDEVVPQFRPPPDEAEQRLAVLHVVKRVDASIQLAERLEPRVLSDVRLVLRARRS